MSQFNAPTRRSGGDLDVFTALACVAFLILAAGVFFLVRTNMEHSEIGPGTGGGPFTLVSGPR